ncbi:polymorphic toxin type 47 domain-containing protein [Paenibacillus thiaminolyticus]|uniref:polymorphic toxin type 47 domain-containing protein n=1 Tax=Paenibacillus thiaminolyticus TaxID=49283 RepID=UPI003B97F3EE
MAGQPKPELCRVKEDNRNLFEKSWDSICELGKGAYEAAAERNEKKFDSIGSFLDYISSGIPKAMYTSYMDRAEHWLDSPADAANHLTFGIHGMIRGAMFPKEVASPEHWVDLLGTSSWVVGGPVTKGLIKSPNKMLQAPKVGKRTSPKINKPKYGVVPKSGGSTVNWGQAKTFINERFEALQKSAGQLSKNKLAYDGPSANYKSSTQKPLEPTKNQIEVRKYYPGSDPKNSASGSTSGKNKNSNGKGTGAFNYKPKPGFDLDWRGSGKKINDALNEAFRRTGFNKDEFEVTKWAKNEYGKSVPVEWKGKKGTSAQHAEVNIDYAHDGAFDKNGVWNSGPDVPHVGYQTGKGKDKKLGHIFLDDVPYGRSKVKE